VGVYEPSSALIAEGRSANALMTRSGRKLAIGTSL
jgi:hypothetical protein